MSEYIDKVPDILLIISLIISTASAIAAVTPSPEDDTKVAKVQAAFKKIVDVLGLNVGNAKK